MDLPMEQGTTSAIEPGPWHYGADYVTVYFRAEPSKLKELLPAPFVVGDGACMAYVCEIVAVSGGNPELVGQEAAVGIACSYRGRSGIYFPVMWVDSEWSLLRGILNGYAKRLADKIVMTRRHPLNPGLGPVGSGTTFSGYCMKGGVRTLWVQVTLESQGAPKDLVGFGPTYGTRRFSSTDQSQAGVSEAVEISKSNSRVSDVWKGKGSLTTSLDLGTMEPLRGAVYSSGFTISGSKVLG